ncbi:hypothetical protein E2320_022430 [Naja naja]|nr:hypothetical protein E2320_022430 [Naja naja]
MASIFSIFKVPQLGVGFEFSAGDRIDFPSFLWINHKESPQYVGLVQLLLYFQWNWVGLLSSESDNGEHFISTLTPMLKEKEICLAFTERLKYNDFQITLNKLIRIFIIWPKIEVLIPSNYQQFLALMFAVSMVNKDFLLLPNITLGFHIYIHFHVEMFISLNSLSMLSSQGQVVPGYKCDQEDTLLSVTGGLNAKSSS